DVHAWCDATSSTITSTPFDARSASAAACARKNVPFAVTSSASSQSSSVTSASAFGTKPSPAEWTTSSSPPSSSSAFATSAAAPARVRRSPSARPAASTDQPSARSRSAIAAPSRPVPPATTTMTQGDTVTWVNKDTANHQVLADKGQFVSPILSKNQTFSFTFNAAGTYTYKDELHPKLTGKIVVKGLPPTLTLAVSSQ